MLARFLPQRLSRSIRQRFSMNPAQALGVRAGTGQRDWHRDVGTGRGHICVCRPIIFRLTKGNRMAASQVTNRTRGSWKKATQRSHRFHLTDLMGAKLLGYHNRFILLLLLLLSLLLLLQLLCCCCGRGQCEALQVLWRRAPCPFSSN